MRSDPGFAVVPSILGGGYWMPTDGTSLHALTVSGAGIKPVAGGLINPEVAAPAQIGGSPAPKMRGNRSHSSRNHL